MSNPSFRSPWVGMRQYTNGFSSKKVNPGYIARARSNYNKLCSELSDKHGCSGYIAIESDSGEYFINANKEVAKRELAIKYPGKLICIFKLKERTGELI